MRPQEPARVRARDGGGAGRWQRGGRDEPAQKEQHGRGSCIAHDRTNLPLTRRGQPLSVARVTT